MYIVHSLTHDPVLSFSVEWDNSTDDAHALAAIQNYTSQVEELAKERGVYLESKCMNDAGDFQDVLASFGSENLATLGSIASKYDPLQVFQVLQNNGFLLSKA